MATKPKAEPELHPFHFTGEYPKDESGAPLPVDSMDYDWQKFRKYYDHQLAYRVHRKAQRVMLVELEELIETVQFCEAHPLKD